MTSKPTAEQSHSLIRQIMKEQGATFPSLAKDLNFRHEKLASAVKCSTGVTPSTINMRKGVATALGLDPAEVWSPEYLEYSGRKTYETGPYAVPSASKLKPAAWEKLPPRMRVRALCKDKGIDLGVLQEKFGVTYRVLTAAIYGTKTADALRQKIADELGRPIEDIWPDIYCPKVVPVEIVAQTVEARSEMDAFYGFGNIMA